MSVFDRNQPDEIRSGPTDTTLPARHRVRRLVLTGVAGAVIVGGGGAYAFASGDGGSATTTPSAPASGAPAAPGNGSAPAAPADAPPITPPQAGPHIDGEVTAVSGSTITVKDPDGFTRTIVTSGDTKYDGVSSPVATGTKIHATGTVDSNGTSLDATEIGTMPTPGKDGPPAPPAGDGKNAPTPPSGGPSGAPAAPSGAPSAPSGASSAPSSSPSGSKSSGSTSSSPSGSKSSGSTSSSPSASPTGS